MTEFNYIIDRINHAAFDDMPFRHLYIEDFFIQEHFSEIVNSPEVNIGPVESDEELISQLHTFDFKEISFPGSTTDLHEYLNWHKDPTKAKNLNEETCDGFGVTFRLQKARVNSIVGEITEFLMSLPFWESLADKFNLDLDAGKIDTGLQKYLDGYEISPHPDIRQKALTFMINVNPSKNSENLDFHTHYMRFKPEKDFVRNFWSQNLDADRCWVPWSWCETYKQQRSNNSVVIFAPSDNSLHAIKASYHHLLTQRTQFYGNLWFKESKTKCKPDWRHFDN